jgi:hypothetical protein
LGLKSGFTKNTLSSACLQSIGYIFKAEQRMANAECHSGRAFSTAPQGLIKAQNLFRISGLKIESGVMIGFQAFRATAAVPKAYVQSYV